MRSSYLLLFFLLLSLVAAPVAHAGPVETDGFTVNVPAGYRKMLKAELDASAFKFPMAHAFISGDPVIHVFVKGVAPEPEAAVCVVYMELEEEAGRLSDKEFAQAQAQMRGMLGAEFKMTKRTFDGEYDAIQVQCRLENIPTAMGVEGDVRFMVIGCGKSAAMIGLVNYQPEYAADADVEWTAMVGSIDLHPPTDWMFMLMLAASLGGIVFFIGRVLLMKPPKPSYARSGGFDYTQPAPDTGGRSMDGMPIYGEEVQRQAANVPVPRSGDEMPQVAPTGLVDPAKSPVERAPLPARGGGDVTPGEAGSGLISTLPPGGRWSDANKS